MMSSYFWMYIVITVFFTMLTVGLWYYFNVFRHTARHKVLVANSGILRVWRRIVNTQRSRERKKDEESSISSF